jgi:GNAT superfamily N-acetyltransferase
MTPPHLVLTDAPSADDVAVITGGLTDFNVAKTGYVDREPLVALARDPATGATLGGMLGRTLYGSLTIETVFLPETLRGHDLGAELLRMMEAEAIRRGCKSGVLVTMTFQAPGFYARHGWQEFGRVPCDPPGSARVFMTKSLG